MDLQLSGKSALVTGGTRGIGRAIVETLLEEGAKVSFCARNQDEVRRTEKDLAGRWPPVRGTVLDVADGEGVIRWVEESAATFGGIDIVVNNVSALAIPESEENWQTSIAVDLMGTVHVCKAALPHLERSGSPSIINISSVSGREVDFAGGPYGTVKSAIIGYTAHLAFAHAAKGIRANTVSPGNTYFPGGVWESIEQGNPELFRMAMDLNPTGRMGSPQDTANAVAFLASPRAGRISGTNLVVDGALTRGIQF